eukprot:CAMPEP_0179092192 /NCGR_PEP_ID=MMETSP0796-20121207/42153_1 /TAXON_ID=73915 /ORGANISM="Pyrodinium bahamense, Strain pbaha01" /LENGTH=233 /DNA_ID=CAMNT_0020789795 /DNA_START=17 /DNA_END=718 /DNA_ORIENTATION=+
MAFPADKDSEGRLIVPSSEITMPRIGEPSSEDIEYEPPFLPSLPHNPLKALLVPRPIGWISTRGEDGDNLSPYSFFGYLAPDVVFFGAGGPHVDGGEKDALRDARTSRAFCVNLVPWSQRITMSASAAEVPRCVDEFCMPLAPGHLPEAVALEKAACHCIDAPCVAGSPLVLECEVLELVTLTENHDVVVIGKVVQVAAGDEDVPVASRGGYYNYFRVAPEHCFGPEFEDSLW